jgi:hypothetical protein
MTDTDGKQYAEDLLLGVLQQIGPDEYSLVSDDRKKIVDCFQYAALASIARAFNRH